MRNTYSVKVSFNLEDCESLPVLVQTLLHREDVQLIPKAGCPIALVEDPSNVGYWIGAPDPSSWDWKVVAMWKPKTEKAWSVLEHALWGGDLTIPDQEEYDQKMSLEVKKLILQTLE